MRLYDVTIDAWREPTQADLDAYQALGHAYGRIRTAFNRGEQLREEIEAAHSELMTKPWRCTCNDNVSSEPAAPIWNCGHAHPTRAEAIACKRRQAGALC